MSGSLIKWIRPVRKNTKLSLGKSTYCRRLSEGVRQTLARDNFEIVARGLHCGYRPWETGSWYYPGLAHPQTASNQSLFDLIPGSSSVHP